MPYTEKSRQSATPRRFVWALPHTIPRPSRGAASWLLTLLALPMLIACGASPAPPANAPPRVSEPHTENQRVDPTREHRAPPPAYGNKVVMAQGPAPRANF